MRDPTVDIAQGRRPDQQVMLLAVFGGDRHFTLMRLAVFKAPGHRTWLAGLRHLAVGMKTAGSFGQLKIL